MIGYYQKTFSHCAKEIQAIREGNENVKDRILAVQLFLLKKIIYVEGKIREHKRLMNSELRPDKQGHFSSKLDDYRRIRYLLRCVGDAIAFLYLDRWDIKPQWQHKDAGFISGKSGLSKELEILKGLFQHGEFAVLNDVTNVLRFGDITHFHGGHFNTFEVKLSKSKSSRTSRQKRKLKALHDYMRTDETAELYSLDHKLIRKAAHSSARDHLKDLNDIIAKAAKNGKAIKKVESGLIYEASYETHETDIQELLDMCNAPPIVVMLNAYKYEFSGYVPSILSIRDTDAFIAFLRGELILTVAVDPSVIHKRFKELGFETEFKNDEKWAIRVTCSKHEDFYMMVGQHFFGRIFAEFLSLDWFMNELIHRATRIIESSNEQS